MTLPATMPEIAAPPTAEKHLSTGIAFIFTPRKKEDEHA
jgi:hypothetical protein